ncbi:unnamed protein product [Polarella glacialis]|uniref:Uncharacterized protein n=1 Tax=Polarella glacialis TaxID=89957 RepID=A0A813FTA6_POLGL|nr:unnamed protein product [Polarella glacialis]
MEYAKGYYGAHQAILADLSVDQISWCDVPTILLLTLIPPNTVDGGITVMLTPIPRVVRSRGATDGIPAQFVINPFTFWVWVGGVIARRGAQYQLVPGISKVRKTLLLVLFIDGVRVAGHLAPYKVRPFLDRWRVYAASGFKYTLHVGPPALIGRIDDPPNESGFETIKEKLDVSRFGGDPNEFAQSEFEADLDDIDEKMDEVFLEDDAIDPCEIMDLDEIADQEVQKPYSETVEGVMTQMDEVIDTREDRPASDLTNAHHASPERPWMKVNIDVADRFRGQRLANLAINHEKHNPPLHQRAYRRGLLHKGLHRRRATSTGDRRYRLLPLQPGTRRIRHRLVGSGSELAVNVFSEAVVAVRRGKRLFFFGRST